MTDEQMAERAAAVVDTWPLFSTEQIERLAILLRPVAPARKENDPRVSTRAAA